MELFYLILAHKNLSQVERMINALKHERAKFFIHFDKKIPDTEIKRFNLDDNPNIVVIRTRYDIKWGGFNMVKATLSLLRAAIRIKKKGYFILMSGQDFPIKSPEFIYRFLNKNYGNQYLEHFPLPNKKLKDGLDRINYHWFVDKLGVELSAYLCRIQKANRITRPYFDGFPPYGGSQWWCITDECVVYILKFLKKNRIYEEYFETCFIADEIFFNTLILNSSFNNKTVNKNLKYIDWGDGIPSAHPRTLNEGDLNKIINSDCLWARKFSDTDSFILNKIEELW